MTSAPRTTPFLASAFSDSGFGFRGLGFRGFGRSAVEVGTYRLHGSSYLQIASLLLGTEFNPDGGYSDPSKTVHALEGFKNKGKQYHPYL